MTAPSKRAHSRQPKIRPCRGCGTMLNASTLHGHEGACVRTRVLPGTRFHIKAQTIVGGRSDPKRVRRPIEVEVIRPKGDGWVVRSLHSGREIEVKNFRRFLDWNEFAPGLRKEVA